MTSRRALLACAAVLAVAAAGCGGGDESSSGSTEATPTSEWADGFCTAITTWTSNIADIEDQFTDLSSFSEDSLQQAADDLEASTNRLVEDLRGLGAPDTESGEEIEQSIDELATTVEAEIDEIRAAVENASGITELPGAVQDILDSLGAMSTAFSSTLSTIGDADVQSELEDALETSPACDEIAG